MVTEFFWFILTAVLTIGVVCLAAIGILATIGVCKEIIDEYDLEDIFNKSKE